jgi:hypothetical protein
MLQFTLPCWAFNAQGGTILYDIIFPPACTREGKQVLPQKKKTPKKNQVRFSFKDFVM